MGHPFLKQNLQSTDKSQSGLANFTKGLRLTNHRAYSVCSSLYALSGRKKKKTVQRNDWPTFSTVPHPNSLPKHSPWVLSDTQFKVLVMYEEGHSQGEEPRLEGVWAVAPAQGCTSLCHRFLLTWHISSQLLPELPHMLFLFELCNTAHKPFT